MSRLHHLIMAVGLALMLSAPFAKAAVPPSAETAEFIRGAMIGNNFEIESSRMALQKSTHAGVRAFAEQMISDHSKAMSDLKQAVDTAGLDMPAEADMDNVHAGDLRDLSKYNLAQFDRNYVDEQSHAHDEAISAFTNYANTGDNAVLKNFAHDMLPTLAGHRKVLDSIDVK